MKKTVFLFTLFSIAISSYEISAQSSQQISLKDFTDQYYDIVSQNNLFKEIDFFVTKEFTIRRKLRTNEVSASHGKLEIHDNIRYEYIYLSNNNVGYYHSTSGYSDLEIAFDANHPNNAFQFNLRTSKDNRQLFYLDTYFQNDELVVDYASETWEVLVGPGINQNGTNFVYLLFDNSKDLTNSRGVDTLKSFPKR